MPLLERQRDRQIQVAVGRGAPGILVNPIRGQPPHGPPQMRVKFDVTRSIDTSPGRARIAIWNLGAIDLGRLEAEVGQFGRVLQVAAAVARNPIDALIAPGGTIAAVSAAGQAWVRLDAGYGVKLSQLFVGNVSRGGLRSKWNGVTRITTIAGGDGELQSNTAIANKSFNGGTPLVPVLTYISKALGLTLTMAPEAIALLGPFVLTGGSVLNGLARDALSELLSPLEPVIEWWIDDGKIWVFPRGGALQLPPLVVSSEPLPGTTRLLNQPEGLDGGGVSIRMQLTPQLRLGQLVLVQSTKRPGLYRCEALRHAGDNRAGEFVTQAMLRVPGPAG